MVKSFLNFLVLVPKMVLVFFLTFSNYAIISSWKDDSDRKEFLEKNEIMTNYFK